jgi:NIMA (never in mitosis gene a)-related kinase
MEIADNGDLQ